MYCIRCGVKLAEEKKPCPLCGTVPFHPELEPQEGKPLYPQGSYPSQQVSRTVAMTVISTVLFLLPMVITVLCDVQVSPEITWSGFVIGALITVYVWGVLPFWFRKPNPVIFVPCGFVALAGFVLFNAQSFTQAGTDLVNMFGLSGLPFATEAAWYYLRSYGILFLLGFVGATPLVRDLARRVEEKRIVKVLQPVILMALLLLCTAYLVDGSFSPFLYFRF